MRKIFVVGAATDYMNWMEGVLTNKMADADLVVFTGGEDVDPSIYSTPENKHPRTGSNIHRDIEEMDAYKEAKELNKPCIGICRGSQFLCVMSGGRLVQDQPNPSAEHPIKMYDGTVFNITSSHHQAQYPYELPEAEYRILGWTEGMLRHHQDGKMQEMNPPQECEVVLYPKTNCLAIQGHPEWMLMDSPCVKYLRGLLNKFLTNTIINEKATANA